MYQVSAANPEATGRHNKIDKTHRKGAWKTKDQVGLQEALYLQDFIQDHLEYYKCWNSKEEFFLIKQPSSPL